MLEYAGAAIGQVILVLFDLYSSSLRPGSKPVWHSAKCDRWLEVYFLFFCLSCLYYPTLLSHYQGWPAGRVYWLGRLQKLRFPFLLAHKCVEV